MIVLSTKNQEYQSAPAECSSQELVAAVAIPKITPYAQTAVQADFGKGSETEQNHVGSELELNREPKGAQAPSGFVGDLMFLIGIAAMPPVMFLVFLLFK